MEDQTKIPQRIRNFTPIIASTNTAQTKLCTRYQKAAVTQPFTTAIILSWHNGIWRFLGC